MSKLTTGVLLIIGAPVAYVTGVLFGIIPPASDLQAYGGCRTVKNPGDFDPTDLGYNASNEIQEICWDGVHRVIDPSGLSVALFFAVLFIAGLVLIGIHMYQRRMFRKVFAILLDFVIVLALLYSIFITLFCWLGYISATSPDCNELGNSMIRCNPASYLPAAVGFSLISILLVVIVVMKARRELRNKKTNSNISRTHLNKQG